MNIGTRFAIGGAITSAILAVSVGVVLIHESTADLNHNAESDLATRIAAVAPDIAQTPTQDRLVDALSANSTANGIRVIRNGIESRIGSMPLHPPDLDTNKVTRVRENGDSWLADSVSVPVDQSISNSPVEVDMFYPTNELDKRINAIRVRVSFVVALSILVAAGLSWIVGMLVSRPLRRLSSAVVARQSVPDRRVPENQHVQEVDELGHTINGLVEQLQVEHARTRRALEAARGFAFNAVHELRTPLTSINTDLDVLKAHSEMSPDERVQMIENVANQHVRLSTTLTALHDLARGEFQSPDELVEVDLAEVAEQSVDSARAFNPNVSIDLITPDHLPVKGWAEGLRLAIDNLLTNAIKHGNSERGMSKVRVELSRTDEWVTLIVQDNGRGVSNDKAEAIFEQFVRGDTAAPGSGLGLALVRQQAELHGGSIHVEPADPQGARFVWRIPSA